jgi:hypothetical protein
MWNSIDLAKSCGKSGNEKTLTGPISLLHISSSLQGLDLAHVPLDHTQKKLTDGGMTDTLRSMEKDASQVHTRQPVRERARIKTPRLLAPLPLKTTWA